MKKLILLGVLALALVFVTTPVRASYMTYGDVDTITHYALLGDSGTSENNWLNSLGFVEVAEYLGSTLSWVNVENTIWAALIPGTPGDYFVKHSESQAGSSVHQCSTK